MAVNHEPAPQPDPNEGWEWGLEDEKRDESKSDKDDNRFGTDKDFPHEVPKEEVASIPGKRFGVSSDFLNESDPLR
jgi:hypothetical protein